MSEHEETSREKFRNPEENPGQASGDRLNSQVSRHRDPSHKVPDSLQFFEEFFSGEPPDSQNVLVGQPAVEPEEKTSDVMRVSSEEEPTGLPFIAQWSKRPSMPTGRHNVFYTFSNKTKCEVFKVTKTTQAPCKNRPRAGGDRDSLTVKHW